MSRFIPILALAAILCLPPVACPADDWGIDALLQEFSAIKQSTQRFVEHKNSSLLAEAVTSRGTLFYKSPDRLVKRIESPVQATWFIHGDEVILESPGQSQKRFSMERYPMLIPLTESVRSLLSGDKTDLEKYYQLDLSGGRNGWSIRMYPRDAAVQSLIKEVVVTGAGPHISDILTVEANGDSTNMEIVSQGTGNHAGQEPNEDKTH